MCPSGMEEDSIAGHDAQRTAALQEEEEKE